MTEEDIEKLDEIIQDELGVDLKQYRNQEVADNFMALLAFPKYVLTWILLSVFSAFVLFSLGFFALDLVYIEYFLYLSLGLLLFLSLGFAFGLLLCTRKMRVDIWNIIVYSEGLAENIARDRQIAKQHTQGENKGRVRKLLFKGMIYLVTIPVLAQAVANRFWLLGGLLSFLVRRILGLVADRITIEEKALQAELTIETSIELSTEETPLEAESESAAAEEANQPSLMQRLKKIFDLSFRVFSFPFQLATGLLSLLLLVLLYLLH